MQHISRVEYLTVAAERRCSDDILDTYHAETHRDYITVIITQLQYFGS